MADYNHFGNRQHWRMETVDRGAVKNIYINYKRGGNDLNQSVSSQNPMDMLSDDEVTQLRIPLSMKIYPKGMVWVRPIGDTGQYASYKNTGTGVNSTNFDHPFPDTNQAQAKRLIGGMFVDQSKNSNV